MALIQRIYTEYQGIYGYRRITIYINHYEPFSVNHKRVYRLMKLMGLKSVIRKKRYHYRPSTPKHVAENCLHREFDASKKYEKLLTDVTEFKLSNGNKAYLSAVYDLHSHSIVAYHLGKHNNNQLVKTTIDQIASKIIPNVTVFHSDRGFQYTSNMFHQWIEETGAIQSMSRVSRCIDNGPMEGFWGLLKSEMYQLNTYHSFKELEEDIKAYIHFFNTKRVSLRMGLAIPKEKALE